jgi:hypothetical protein
MNTTGTGTEELEATGGDARRPPLGKIEQVLAEWAASGKTVREVAAETGWSIHTLYRWRRDARRPKSTTAAGSATSAKLLAVPKPGGVEGGWSAELAIGVVSVRLSAGVPVDWVGRLVRELKSC